MDNWFKSLSLDYWYKMLILGSLFFLFIALTVPFQGVSNAAVALMAFGLFWIGTGEWINHPLQTRIYPGFSTRRFTRRNSPLGVCFVVLGVALILRGAWLV